MKKFIMIILVLNFCRIGFCQEYTEKIEYQVEISENEFISVRRSDIVLKDGIEIARKYHRHVLCPGDKLDNEVKKVKDIANIVWTKEIIEKYKNDKIEQEKKIK